MGPQEQKQMLLHAETTEAPSSPGNWSTCLLLLLLEGILGGTGSGMRGRIQDPIFLMTSVLRLVPPLQQLSNAPEGLTSPSSWQLSL